jgi:hypothetical protein
MKSCHLYYFHTFISFSYVTKKSTRLDIDSFLHNAIIDTTESREFIFVSFLHQLLSAIVWYKLTENVLSISRQHIF